MTSDTRVVRTTSGSDWESEYFDPARWHLPAVAARSWCWITANRWRRWGFGLVFVVVVTAVLPATIGAVAYATTFAQAPASVNSGLSWMGVRDSAGAPLSNYVFAMDTGGLGGILHPEKSALALVIGLEFAGWMVIVTSAIWLIGYALSFQWLNLFSRPLEAVAHALSGQIATPALLIVAATIGAFFVAWFTVRGFHSKATMQVVTMLLVGVVGPVFLAAPLADVLSSDGLLAQGRDLGISVAAGVNGVDSPDPAALVPRMQATLADGFAAYPLQVWNLGHVLTGTCQAQWSAGIKAGSADRIESGLTSCDPAAVASIKNPSLGQLGAGLILLLAGTIMLLFAIYLSLRIIKAGLDTVYHGFMAIFGWAAGGFVYGPTQTFFVRNVVDGFISGARMACYTIFLGVWVLFITDLLREVNNNVMAIFVIGAIVEVVAIFQLRRLNNSLTSGNEWMANRFALAMQGVSRSGGGSGSVAALGMGQTQAKNKLADTAAMVGLAAATTMNNSPITEWLFGGTRNWMRPRGRIESNYQRHYWGMWSDPGFETLYRANYSKYAQYNDAARRAMAQFGGVDTAMGAARVLQAVADVGGGMDASWGALIGAGFTDEKIMHDAIHSWNVAAKGADSWILKDKDLANIVAATRRAQKSARQLMLGDGTADEVAADISTLRMSAFRFRRNHPGGVTLDHGAQNGPEWNFVNDYMANPSQVKMEMLREASEGRPVTTGVGTPAHAFLSTVDRDSAARMMQWIGNTHAKDIQQAVEDLVADPGDIERIRHVRRVASAATDTDVWASGSKRTPWNALQPPAANPQPSAEWQAAHEPVYDLLR
ncbi:MAG: hypothetical protein J2P18_11360 [Nocardia sp.]|nr:hypothetical protein [Nocardia sp.]